MLLGYVDGDARELDKETVSGSLCQVLNRFADGFSECVTLVMSSREIVGRSEILDPSLTVSLMLNFLTKHGLQLLVSLSERRSRDSEINLIRANIEIIITDAETLIREHKNMTPYCMLPVRQKCHFSGVKEALARIGTLEGLSLTHNTDLDAFFTLVQTVDDLLRGYLSWLTGYLHHRQLPTDTKLMRQAFPITSLKSLVGKYGPAFLQCKAGGSDGEQKFMLQNIEAVVFDVENLYREASGSAITSSL